MSNRHMNIFHHYSQTGTLPIENNISRGLAIILQEEAALLYMLLSAVRSQGVTIADPQTSYEVGFQIESADFGDYTNVVGVSLTASELTGEYTPSTGGNVNEHQITDISIMFDDTLIIIEVKRTNEDCRKQLDDQINRFLESKASLNMPINVQRCAFEWRSIMTLLNRFIEMQRGKASRLVEDFYNEVLENYPTWGPREPLRKLPVSAWERINQRLHFIKLQYMSAYEPEKQLLYGRAAIPIGFTAASECNVRVNTEFSDETGNTGVYLTIGIWPSDTCTQYWRLADSIKDADGTINPETKVFLNSRFTTAALADGRAVKVRIYPYVKFCHFNKGVMWLYSEAGAVNNIDRLIALGNEINGKWSRGENNADWNRFKKLIRDSGLYADADLKAAEEEFKTRFEDTERSYFTASIGFEIYAYIPYSEAQRLDNSLNSTAIAGLIHDILAAFHQKLEPVK